MQGEKFEKKVGVGKQKGKNGLGWIQRTNADEVGPVGMLISFYFKINIWVLG